MNRSVLHKARPIDKNHINTVLNQGILDISFHSHSGPWLRSGGCLSLEKWPVQSGHFLLIQTRWVGGSLAKRAEECQIVGKCFLMQNKAHSHFSNHPSAQFFPHWSVFPQIWHSSVDVRPCFHLNFYELGLYIAHTIYWFLSQVFCLVRPMILPHFLHYFWLFSLFQCYKFYKKWLISISFSVFVEKSICKWIIILYNGWNMYQNMDDNTFRNGCKVYPK